MIDNVANIMTFLWMFAMVFYIFLWIQWRTGRLTIKIKDRDKQKDEDLS